MKKIKLTIENLINLWMTKIYNTTIQEEQSKNPELFTSSEWYKQYPVTQQQHDEWEIEAKTLFHKYVKEPKNSNSMFWGLTYLNSSPYIKKI